MSKKNKTTYAMSRRRLTGIIILCLLVAAVFVGLDHSSIAQKWQRQPKSQEQVRVSDFEKYHAKTFTVINVVDGDTVDIDIPDGRYEHTRIRLWGVDTPETKHPEKGVTPLEKKAVVSIVSYSPATEERTSVSENRFSNGVMYFGPEAAEFTHELALEKQVAVYLEEHRTRGYYGRLLAYIRLPDGKFLNEVLLTEGFAYADVRFRHSFYQKYKRLEAAARSQKKGLWPGVTRDQLPEWLQERKPNLLNK